MTNAKPNVLEFQWSVYPDAHHNRRNLLIHLATVPLFMGGNVLLLSSPFLGFWAAPTGLVAMVVAMGAQGAGHEQEATPPAPFRGPLDVVLRIFAEQWITFPRFVLSGGLARAMTTR